MDFKKINFECRELYREYFESGCEHEKALAQVKSFLKKYPCAIEARLFLGKLLSALGCYRQAIDELEKVLLLDGAHINARFEIADAYLGLGDNEKANQYLQDTFTSVFNELEDGFTGSLPLGKVPGELASCLAELLRRNLAGENCDEHNKVLKEQLGRVLES